MRRLRGDEGATSVVIAITMTLVLGIGALVVDVGALYLRKARVQDAADAAALAIAQQCYQAPATNVTTGCDPAIIASAVSIAESVARPALDDTRPADEWIDVEFVGLDRVMVSVSSDQRAFFSQLFGNDSSTVPASATAQWSPPATLLPVAFHDCALPEVSDGRSFIGTGLYNGLQSLLGSALGILNGASIPDYLERLLTCGTNVLAGGWIDVPVPGREECNYDPILLASYVGATLNKLIPITSCADKLPTLIGQSVLIPIYESALPQTVGELLGTATITRYAEVVLTGYEFDGLLGLGSIESYPTGDDPSCANTLGELLGLTGVIGGIIDLLDILLGPLLGPLLDLVGLCQGIQGHVVDPHLTPEEAAERLNGFRLID